MCSPSATVTSAGPAPRSSACYTPCCMSWSLAVFPGSIIAAHAARLLDSITPAGAVEAARCELAAAFIDDLRRTGAQLRETKDKLTAAVRASGTSLTGLFGRERGPGTPGTAMARSLRPGRNARLPMTGEQTSASLAAWQLWSSLELGPFPGAVPCARLHAKLILWE